MVDCEHRSRPEGRHSSAILNTGSMRRLVASLPSSYPAAIISSRKRMMSASVCTVLPGSRRSSMQAARRSAIPSWRSISRTTSRPPSEDRRPPSNRATTSFPAIGDRPGSGRVGSTMAGGRSRNGVASLQQPNPTRFQWITPHPPTSCIIRANDDTRGFSISKELLTNVAAEYLARPELQSDYFDWLLLDTLIFMELDAFGNHAVNAKGGTGINWGSTFANGSQARYLAFSFLFGLIGFGIRYVAPAISIL